MFTLAPLHAKLSWGIGGCVGGPAGDLHSTPVTESLRRARRQDGTSLLRRAVTFSRTSKSHDGRDLAFLLTLN